MGLIINLIVVALIIGVLTFFYCTFYNKIINHTNKANVVWANIVKEVNIRFNLLAQLRDAASLVLDEETKSALNKVIDSYRTKVAIQDVINTYYEANNIINTCLSKINSPEWTNAFNESFNRIESLRREYNDTILKINNLVKMFPTSIIAKIHGITPWIFFRGVE